MRDLAMIFGYNDYSKEIYKQIEEEYEELHFYVLNDEQYSEAKADGVNVEKFDLSDDWEFFENTFSEDRLLIFCSLKNDAENIFLTISLRSIFEDSFIISLAKDQESGNKLKMAGASKVLYVSQTTANIIVDYIEKPVVTSVLGDILIGSRDIKLFQIEVNDGSKLIGQAVKSLGWSKRYSLLLIAIYDKEFNTLFSFTLKGYKHKIEAGDILLMLGFERDIEEFEKEMGVMCDEGWCNRGR